MEFSINERYKHKIKTAAELSEILGNAPREKKVIMCHGVFDVVHPGHLRHLLYAKSKAPILIASLTADSHINKGIYRPHIPQELRAINLAAFEFVDYVVIDEFATPINNIEKIKPDIFAKGYEYSENFGTLSKTDEELKAVSNYGGEVIFTPGDIVFSSSALINVSPPKIRIEMFMTLMSRFNISFEDIRNALRNLSGVTVHVVGDTIVDTYTECTMFGGQTKTPTMSVKFESKKSVVGGAGIVAEHLKSAGAKVKFTSIIGSDDMGIFTSEHIESIEIESNLIIDRNRPTVNKNAIIVGNYRLLKIDTLDNQSISDEILNEITEDIKNTNADAVIFSDFRHGIFNKRTIPRLIAAIPPHVYKVADSQVASRWGNITDFTGFDLVTPNEREARFALADQDSGIRPLASQLFNVCQTNMLILKLGDRGILTCINDNHESLDSFFVMESFVNNVVDPVGAGDALLAYATLTMIKSNNPVLSSIIGNLAAACECEVNGNVPITPEKIIEKLNAIQEVVEARNGDIS